MVFLGKAGGKQRTGGCTTDKILLRIPTGGLPPA